MALLLPIHVDVLVVSDDPLRVPTLDGAPFTENDMLGRGAHIHWALPDALTQGSVVDAEIDPTLRFRAIPDLWVLVRWNPPSSTSGRTYRAWLIDSRSGVTTDLSTPSGLKEPALPRPWLTAVGLLDEGVTPAEGRNEVQAYTLAYHPSSLGKVAFYDSLSDVRDAGPLSYAVVGLYSSLEEDPWNREKTGKTITHRKFESQVTTKAGSQSKVTKVKVDLSRTAKISAELRPTKLKLRTDSHLVGARVASRATFETAIAQKERLEALGAFERGQIIQVTPPKPSTTPRLFAHGQVVGVPWMGWEPKYNKPLTFEPRVEVYPTPHEAAIHFFTEEVSTVQKAALSGLLMKRTDDIFEPSRATNLGHREHAQGFGAHVGGGTKAAPLPRYYRPTAPVVVIGGCGRSFRYGEDGRFDPDRKPSEPGKLAGRDSQQMFRQLTILALPHGGDLLQSLSVSAPDVVGQGPSLNVFPKEVSDLIFESALLDPTNAARMAEVVFQRVFGGGDTDIRTRIQFGFERALEGWWGNFGGLHSQLREVTGQQHGGTLPSLIAVNPWREPFIPLFAEVEYTLTPAISASSGSTSSVQGSFVLGEVDMEPTAGYTESPALRVKNVQRVVLSPELSRIVGKTVSSQEIENAQALTAALTALDTNVSDSGSSLRSGTLRIQRLRIVDVFGQTKDLVEGEKVISGAGSPQTNLPPRIPAWSHLSFRFVDGAGNDATPQNSAVCGYVLPDYLEHALEVFDESGTALGQLRHAPLGVVWEPNLQKAPVDSSKKRGDPARVISPNGKSGLLLKLIQGMYENSRPSPQGDVETAVSAFLRAIDTTLHTLRSDTSTDHLTALFGRPLAILRAEVGLAVAPFGAVNPLNAPNGQGPNPLGVRAQVGSLVQSDDGVVACFLEEKMDRMLVVDSSVKSEARRSGPLRTLSGASLSKVEPIVHPYVLDDPTFEISTQKKSLLLVMDPFSKAYIKTGVLPRKDVGPPKDMLSGLSKLAPSFAVGPVLSPYGTTMLPVPKLPNAALWWLHPKSATELSLEPVSAELGGYRGGKVRAEEGWLTVAPGAHKKEESARPPLTFFAPAPAHIEADATALSALDVTLSTSPTTSPAPVGMSTTEWTEARKAAARHNTDKIVQLRYALFRMEARLGSQTGADFVVWTAEIRRQKRHLCRLLMLRSGFGFGLPPSVPTRTPVALWAKEWEQEEMPFDGGPWDALAIPSPQNGVDMDHGGFRVCQKCKCVAFGGTNAGVACTSGGQHGLGEKVYSVRANSTQTIGQSNWRWCNKCQCLAFGGQSMPGPCPHGGGHDFTGSSNYTLNDTSNANAEPDFSWCQKCGTLHKTGPLVSAGPCAGGGNHDGSASGAYRLKLGLPTDVLNWPVVTLPAESPPEPNPALVEGGFRRCVKCQSLVARSPSGNAGPCASGGEHSLAERQHVIAKDAPLAPGQPNWKKCQVCFAVAFDTDQALCPTGAKHAFTDSPTYTMIHGGPLEPELVPGYRWCSQCMNLAFGEASPGACSAGGFHNLTQSGTYYLLA